MSFFDCTEQEAQWRQEREDLNRKLHENGKQFLDRKGIEKTRQKFRLGPTLESKRYIFSSDSDGVAIICLPIPKMMAKRCYAIGKELTELLPRERETGNAVAYVTRLELMHVTLFHTSHPNDIAPNARRHFPQDVAQLKTMCTRIAPFRMIPVKVLMTSTGAIVMLFECLSSIEKLSNQLINMHAEYSIDYIRHAAKKTFSYIPKTDTRVIIHSTLGRILSPDVHDNDLARLHARCEEISIQLAADPQPVLFDRLWFVEETHFLSLLGPKTEIPLLGDRYLSN
ncbi:uncharacterized protein PHALS_08174 [Plasmopara halstedii]|uniref:Uncharacterized protein n=1 Tax=Plasmopara halstedii TaxID=4781 RepID=A0A0P1AB89_PLAHL|nr:uncharacterized protein PHALS_08174 [Plasmopara halstedii]CEG38079.1 hypothetical protein PHALS_08174 [Plasmopara halstedii]|eukprot:XP_024574448.1 hypothetical protein PHALS_08174 [Plasmopara halstedii]